MNYRNKIHPWEIALAAGLVLAMLAGAFFDHTARDLSDSVLRLHVVANSDSPEDQAVKLLVRDRVLACAQHLLTGTGSAQAAAERLKDHLPDIEREARQTLIDSGVDMPVRAEVTAAGFPTKTYDGFAFPAGTYEALRVTLGEGVGQNWWCVVFPPLCLAASSQSLPQAAFDGGLNEGQVNLITGDSDTYVFTFKCLEWWEKCKAFLFGK